MRESDFDDFRQHLNEILMDGAGMSAVSGEIDFDDEALTEFIDNDKKLMLLAFVQGRTVGNIDVQAGQRIRMAHTASLGMSVNPLWRGRGIGSVMLDEAIKWAEENPALEKICLDVLGSNESAIGLYRNNGFTCEGTKFNQIKYEDGTYASSWFMSRSVSCQARTGALIEEKQSDSQTNSPEEIVSDLKLYEKKNLPIEIWLSESDCVEGFVISIGSDYVLTARIFQQSWLNGFRATKLSCIHEILPADDETFICKALRSRGSLPVESPFAQEGETMADLAGKFHEKFPIAIFCCEYGSKENSVAGAFQGMCDGVVSLKLISRAGNWIPEIERLDVACVEEILFGSKYEETLFQMAERSITEN
ncbi:MAG: GNAT family N-acetyltransferase [Mariniblastus sp.]